MSDETAIRVEVPIEALAAAIAVQIAARARDVIDPLIRDPRGQLRDQIQQACAAAIARAVASPELATHLDAVIREAAESALRARVASAVKALPVERLQTLLPLGPGERTP